MSSLIWIRQKNYDFDELFFFCNLKWDVSDQEFIAQNAYRPKIDPFIVHLSFQDFWRHIQWSPTKCAPQVKASTNCPTEITYLCDSLHKMSEYLVNNDIFRFDVSVNNPESMEISDCLTNLFDNNRRSILTEPSLILEHFVKLSWGTQLQQQIHVFLIIKKTIQFYDVWVV